jgi:hypothetical protein
VSAIDDIVPELFGGSPKQSHRYGGRWAVLNRWRGDAKPGADERLARRRPAGRVQGLCRHRQGRCDRPGGLRAHRRHHRRDPNAGARVDRAPVRDPQHEPRAARGPRGAGAHRDGGAEPARQGAHEPQPQQGARKQFYSASEPSSPARRSSVYLRGRSIELEPGAQSQSPRCARSRRAATGRRGRNGERQQASGPAPNSRRWSAAWSTARVARPGEPLHLCRAGRQRQARHRRPRLCRTRWASRYRPS